MIHGNPGEKATVWRLDRFLHPEQVTVLFVGDEWVLADGDTHTTYKGGYFTSPDAAFKAAIEDAERSIRYGEESKAAVLNAKARYESGH